MRVFSLSSRAHLLRCAVAACDRGLEGRKPRYTASFEMPQNVREHA